MIFALGVAVLSVLAGALLGLAPRARSAVGPVQSFAVVAAAVVVFGQLLPSAMGEVGWAAGAVFLATLLAMMVPERIARRVVVADQDAKAKAGVGVGLEVGFAGLVVHTIGDGVGLGAYGGSGADGSDRLDVVIAIAGHTVPLVAAVVIAFASVEGRGRALIRAAVLALAAACGVGLTAIVGGELLHEAEPWISAVVAALLLHVVAHGARLERPREPRTRLLELVALALGLALLALGDHVHEGGHGDMRSQIGQALWELVLLASPAAVLAAILVVAFSRFGSSLASSPRLSIFARSPWRRELGLTSALLAISFFGPAFAAWRWMTGLVLSVVGRSVPIDLFADSGTPAADREPVAGGGIGDELRARFDVYAAAVVPRAVIVLLAAAYAQALVATGAVGTRAPFDAILAVALPAISPLASLVGVPFLAVLGAKGWSPMAVLIALGLSSMVLSGWVARAIRMRRLKALAIGVGATVIVTALSGLAYRAFAEAFPSPLEVPLAIQEGAALLFAAASLRVVYREGVVGFVGALLSPAGASHAGGERHHS